MIDYLNCVYRPVFKVYIKTLFWEEVRPRPKQTTAAVTQPDTVAGND